ncbi:MAG: sugar ABC transporter substrate-binding protein [Actinobacteria bacterium]|nr:sugar ABC transporter substrate-binding protein [Actinomycetota bacterium]
MKKSLSKLIVFLLCIIMVSTFSFIGCKKAATATESTVVAEETTSVEKTTTMKETTDTETTTAGKKFEGVTIKALLVGGPEYEPWWAKVTAEFEQKTGIKVKYDTLIWEELMKKEITLSAAKSSEYDVYSTHHAQIGAFLNSFAPLNSYLAGDEKDFPAEQVAPAVLENGDIIALPKHTDARILYYRTDLFDVAGVKPPKTWDELIQVAQKLNKPPDQYGFVITGRGDPFLRQYSDLLWEWGGDFIGKDMKPTFNSPEGIAALQFYVDIINKYKIVPSDAAGYGWEEPSRLFAQGKIAMVEDWPGLLGMYNDPKTSQIVGKFSFAPLPAGPKTNITTAASHMMAINKYSTQKDAAWEFVKYLLSKEVLIENYKFNGQVVTRTSALQEIVNTAVSPDKERLAALLAAISTGRTWPVFPEWNEVAPAIWNEGQAALILEKTPEQALSDAETAVIEILQRAGYIK